MKAMRRYPSDQGFTLVELIVTVAVVVLILKFVGWGLAGVTGYEDVRTAARRLETVIQEAKTLAHEKGAVYSLVFVPDSGGNGFRGYRVFRDDDGDDNRTEPTDGNCLRDDNEPWTGSVDLPSRVSLSLENTLPKNANNETCLAFASDGRLANGQGGKLHFVGASGSQVTVTVNAMGWVHVD